MSLNRTDQPKFTWYLVERKSFSRSPLIIADVGARGGAEPHWYQYGDQAQIFGFEPDRAECDRLNGHPSPTPQTYLPVALSDTDGLRTFYELPFAPASGFFKYDMKFVERFPDIVNMAGGKPLEIEVAKLDTLVERGEAKSPEFLKLDVQGGELSVLKGAERSLRRSALGASIEVTFDRWYENAPSFSEVSAYLKSLGFDLYDLVPYKVARKVFPNQYPGALQTGQVIWGQALYLRDGVREFESDFPSKIERGWDDLRVLKLASIMEILGLPDCAVELVRSAKENSILSGWDANELIRLLALGMRYRPLYSGSVQSGIGSALRVMPRPVRNAIRKGAVTVRELADALLRL